MNYQKIYNDIIEKARSENRKKYKGIYYENHHIIPRCIGGTDEKSNLVLLTAKEHFVCHKLLIKIHPDNYQIELAFVIMALNISPTHERIELSPRDYQYARELQSKANSAAKMGNKNRLGKKSPHSKETKKRLSAHFKENVPVNAFKKGQIPWNKGKTYEELKGKEFADNLKNKISNNRKGKAVGHVVTAETRKKISKGLKGKKKSETHIQNMRKPQRRVVCPHCNKEGGINAMHQYHFDKCKFKKQ